MNTLRSQLVLDSLAIMTIVPSSFAQQSPFEKTPPVANIYIADAKGEAQIENGGKIYAIRQSTAFNAPGTVIETRAKAHSTVVYSNGTGMFVDESTRVEIEHFTQEPFHLGSDKTLDTTQEP